MSVGYVPGRRHGRVDSGRLGHQFVAGIVALLNRVYELGKADEHVRSHPGLIEDPEITVVQPQVEAEIRCDGITLPPTIPPRISPGRGFRRMRSAAAAFRDTCGPR